MISEAPGRLRRLRIRLLKAMRNAPNRLWSGHGRPVDEPKNTNMKYFQLLLASVAFAALVAMAPAGGVAGKSMPAIPIEGLSQTKAKSLDDLQKGIEAGRAAGLEVLGGHGLTYRNIAAVAALDFAEFNIGHSIVSRAMFVGMREAVREMKHLLAEKRNNR